MDSTTHRVALPEFFMLLVTMIVVPFAAPAAEEAKGRIVFASDRDGDWDVYVMNADGSNVTNLTNHPADDRFPRWSPDGERISFTSDRPTVHGAQRDVYVMDADGENVRRITNHPASDGLASWSPDGTELAFASCRLPYAPTCWGIFITQTDGSGGERELTRGFHPDWSPDGTQIAFTAHAGGTNNDIFVIGVDGTGRTNVTNDHDQSGLHDGEPAWSPDGTRIAFSRNEPTGQVDIWVMTAEGTGKTNVSNDAGARDFAPTWSPDGTEIAYESLRPSTTTSSSGASARLTGEPLANRRLQYDVIAMRADGTAERNLTAGSNAGDAQPHWRPGVVGTCGMHDEHGPVSAPIHDNLEPHAGPARPHVHRANCRYLVPNKL